MPKRLSQSPLFFSIIRYHSVPSNAYEEYQNPHTQMGDHSPDHESVDLVLLKFQMLFTGLMEDLAYICRSLSGLTRAKAVTLLRGQG